ncbi:MAG: carbohydrate kinase, partial [Blautia sp.]|nr:carbohydrate kinase [Blautia sp.]
MYDIYSIGEMVIDFIPGTEPASYIRNAGGAPANVAIAMRRNGLEAAMCCKVGDDNFGIFLLDT